MRFLPSNIKITLNRDRGFLYNLLNSFCSLIYFIIGLYTSICARVCLGFDFFTVSYLFFMVTCALVLFLLIFFYFALIGNACNEGIPIVSGLLMMYLR